jgi:hypothetical protein
MAFSSVEKVDAANIGLMVLSCIIAFILPFELFLFSYAVLGPLHYLTEIGWLHKKGYYTSGKNDFIFLCVLGVMITLGMLGFSEALGDVSTSLIYIAFLSSLVMVLLKDSTLKIISIILIVFSTLLFNRTSFYEVFFAIYLPTIIHVFLFTGLFILFGALKNKSRIGFASIAVFIACSISFFLINSWHTVLSSREYLINGLGGFLELNRQLINLFGLEHLQAFGSQTTGKNLDVILGEGAGISVMRFIAFAYTYHYLNWFSKTSVIQWYKVPKSTLYTVIAVWIVSVALYIYNYETGLKWLFLLSFLHVLLEFPLNYRSFIGIGQEIGRLIRMPAPSSGK